MSRKRDVLEVGVSRRILWIGAAAYPLQNIARAQTIEIVPNRARAVRHFVAELIIWLVLGGGAIAAINRAELSGADFSGTDPDQLSRIAYYVVVALVGLSSVKLLVTLSRRTLYAMVIETAGSPQTALVSTDRSEVSSLVKQTMDAIDDPHAEFQYQIHNITNIGEQFNISGKHNVGKAVTP